MASTAAHPVVVACPESLAGATALFEAAGKLAVRLGGELVPLRVTDRAGVGPRGAPTPTAPGFEAQLVGGIPAIEIVRFAESRRAELLILGVPPTGQGEGESHRALADAVVRRSELPCLVLPAGQTSFRRMVVALDGSERGMRALLGAWGFRALASAGVVAVFVEAGGDGAAGVVGPGGAVGQRLRAWVASTIDPTGRVQVVHRQGEVVAQVLAELARHPDDLLVVGVRRGGPATVAESTGNGRRLLAATAGAVLTIPL